MTAGRSWGCAISAVVEVHRDAEQAAPPSRRRAVRWNAVLFGVTLAAFAVLVWRRRWMSDDGLIVLRTVRQLLAGHGPVFNAGERVEANTSTVWTALLAVPGLVPGVSLNWAAVLIGLVLSVAGVGFGLDAARRLFGRPRRMVPFGALVVVALPPFWDFGTSGLETGLIVGWLGLAWWLLVRRLEVLRAGEESRAQGTSPVVAPASGAGCRPDPVDAVGPAPSGTAWPVAFVVGLAPLVRPDLALFGLLAAAALVVLEARRGWWRTAALGAVAVAVPLAYEVFRAGYYGLLVPSTALAKEASTARWQQGLHYLGDFATPYLLLLPLALLAVGAAAVLAGRPRRPASGVRRATATVVAVPLLAGMLLAAYVTRVGGDFMHGRMLLPALFCVVLPMMAVPLTRRSALPVLGMGCWALVSVLALRPAYDTLGPEGIANERLYYVVIVGHPNPIGPADFRGHPLVPEAVAALAAEQAPALAVPGPGPSGVTWWLFPTPERAADTLVWLNLGVAGELAPLGTRVLDPVGLTNPLAAHATGLPGGRIGHDKDLPPEWALADAGVGGGTGYLDPAGVAAARQALACPRTQELLASVRDPLTVRRFWHNLAGAWERTSYRYPRDPREAADCGA